MDIKNKVFVVTGGGNGIGRGLVLNLLSKEAKVAAVDIDRDGLDETEKLAGDKSASMSKHFVDITNKDAVSALPEEVINKYGKVDAVINNAGVIQPFVKINNLDYKTIERVMNINFYGAVHMTKAFLPFLMKRPEAHLVNISSMGGFLPVPGQGIYGASKAALKLFSEALYAELSDTQIHVTTVFPGGVETDIATRSGAEIQIQRTSEDGGLAYQPISASKAAERIIEGMMKANFHVLVGSDSKFMNFLYRLAPKFATNYIKKQMGELLAE